MAASDKESGGYYASHDNGGPVGIDHLHPNESPENALQRIKTAGSVSIPPELFEKLYLSPENRVKGDLRKTFGNPTPIGLGGFLLSLCPLSCFLMNWRSDTQAGLGFSDTAMYIFFGGVLLLVSGFMEWILGNTYIATVFMTFGSFWLSFGGTLQPFYGSYAAYSSDPSGAPAKGLMAPGFNNSLSFWLIFMGILCLVYLVCSLRVNLVLFMILLPLPPAFGCLAAAFFYKADAENGVAGAMQKTETLLKAAGALTFVTDMFGWYLFTSLMFASIDAPFELPVFDLSTRIKGASDRHQEEGPDLQPGPA